MSIPRAISRRAQLRLFVGLAGLAFIADVSRAQQRESALSDAEVEKLRDSAFEPPARVLDFIEFLDERAKRIDALTTGKRRPGREEDIHDLLEQITSILDDFEDNLAEYGKLHRDIRKVLPRVVAATERWGTTLKTPPEHAAYAVSRKLALESLADIHETATTLVEEQKAWFLAHPPPKDKPPYAPAPR